MVLNAALCHDIQLRRNSVRLEMNAILVVVLAILSTAAAGFQRVNTTNLPNGRDEAGSYVWNGTLCLFGGRHTQPIECFDPASSTWTRSNTTTDDIHHIQPIVWHNEVHIVAAWHGPFPAGERQLNFTLIYNPVTDTLRQGCKIPTEFARGAAGCVEYKDKFYIINGAVDGHEKKYGAYAYRNLTMLDPTTCKWENLPAQPRYNRDHFEAALVGSTLVLTAGRDSPHGDDLFQFTTAPVELYDLDNSEPIWRVGTNITTQRAGADSIVDGQGGVLVMGGEAINQPNNEALKTVERYDVATDRWETLPSMLVGRHTSGRVFITNPQNNSQQLLVVAAGVGKKGGSPLLTDTEIWAGYK
jgi:hypothetical protein